MIAYDTNVLIYALEGSSQWAKAARDIVEQGEQESAVLSVLAYQELMTGAVLRGHDLDVKLRNILADLSATKFVPVTQAIVERAAALTKKYGKKVYGYDAVHLATAIHHKVSVFVTNDHQLLQLNASEIKIQGL